MKKLIAGVLLLWAGVVGAQTFPVNNLTVAGTSSFTGQAVFTLSPTGPTPTFGDNTTKFATTAFVQAGLVTIIPSVPAGQLYGGTGTAGSTVGVKVPSYWAQSYGVKCDGATNDTTAIQTLINNIIAAGGGTITFPAGVCLIPGGLIEDLSSHSSVVKPYVNLEGQGQVTTQLVANGLAGNALRIIGNSTNDVAYLNISHLAILGNSTAGSAGLQTNDTAYMHLLDVSIQGFIFGWVASDVEQSTIEHSNFLFNGVGIQLNGAVNATGSNSLSFYDDAIGSNTTAGINVIDFAAVSFYNGSIQYNAQTGVGGTHGALFQDSAGGSFCGYNTVSFYGTIFEGNGGAYDIDLNTNFCPGAALTLNGVSFIRTVSYATNNIRTDGTQPQSVVLSGSTIVFSPAYTPSAARPTINLANNTSSVLYDQGGNFFQSALEGPLYPPAQVSAPNGAWVAYTPVIACGSGTIGAATAAGRYRKLANKTVALQITANVTSVGSCGLGLVLGLPTGLTVNSTGSIYPVSAIDGVSDTVVPAAVYFDAGVNIAEIFGTPAAHTYILNGIFETP